MNKYLLLLLCITSFALYLLYDKYDSIKEDRKRVLLNQEELLRQFDESSNKSYNDVRQLNLTISEFRSSNTLLSNKIKALNLKIKNLESISITEFEAKANINSRLNDTIIIHDTLYRPAKSINWNNGYFSLNGIIHSDSLIVKCKYRDTLHQILYRVPKRFLFLKFGIKEIRQIAKFSNPESEVVYQKVIKLEKR